MEEKSKGKKTFWVNTKGIKLFRIKEVLSPPSWTKFRNSMSWDAVFSLFFRSVLFSVLLFNSQIKKRPALFAFQESLNSKLVICIQSSTAEQIPPSLSCLFPFPPQWCQLNWLIEDHAFLFRCSMSFIPNLLMAGTYDANSVWLCCGRGDAVRGKAEERSWDVILCFCCSHSLLQSGGRLASIISAVSPSPSLSLSLSLFLSLMCALVRSLARSLSALHTCTVLCHLIHPPPPLLFFLWFVTVRILITATCCGSSQPKWTITLNLLVCCLSGQILCLYVCVCINVYPHALKYNVYVFFDEAGWFTTLQ